MLKIFKDELLSNHTTMRIGGSAEFFCSVKTKQDLIEALEFAKKHNIAYRILGGGSNILVDDNQVKGLTIKIEIKGLEKISSNFAPDYTLVRVGAGEKWDDFVAWSLEQGLYGLENLSSIPGTVGAAPIQNIGAYGIEVGNYIHSIEVCRQFVDGVKSNDFEFVMIDGKDCDFGYRYSVFKDKSHKNDIVVSVIFKLGLKPTVNADYKDIQLWLEKNAVVESSAITPQLIRRAVIEIRSSKLPDWTKIGTAGSFFKNPIITQQHFADLKSKYPSLPGFPSKNKNIVDDNQVKVSLGWILDHICNVKGLCVGDACVYEKQALVIINKDRATSAQVKELADKLADLVFTATGIRIEPEVVLWE